MVLYVTSPSPRASRWRYDHRDIRVLREIFLHRRAGAGIGAGVAGVVVNLAVVQHGEPLRLECRGQLVADAHYIIIKILCAVAVRLLVLVVPVRRIGLAAVGVDYEYLRSLRGQHLRWPELHELAHVYVVAGGVFDGEPAVYRGLHYVSVLRALDYRLRRLLRLGRGARAVEDDGGIDRVGRRRGGGLGGLRLMRTELQIYACGHYAPAQSLAELCRQRLARAAGEQRPRADEQYAGSRQFLCPAHAVTPSGTAYAPSAAKMTGPPGLAMKQNLWYIIPAHRAKIDIIRRILTEGKTR